MIEFQSRVTGMADRPVANPKSADGMSSPGGEDLSRLGNGERNLSRFSGAKAVRPNELERVSPPGEGELYTDSVYWAIAPEEFKGLQVKASYCALLQAIASISSRKKLFSKRRTLADNTVTPCIPPKTSKSRPIAPNQRLSQKKIFFQVAMVAVREDREVVSIQSKSKTFKGNQRESKPIKAVWKKIVLQIGQWQEAWVPFGVRGHVRALGCHDMSRRGKRCHATALQGLRRPLVGAHPCLSVVQNQAKNEGLQTDHKPLQTKNETVTFEPFGKRRKEFGGAEGRAATERARASPTVTGRFFQVAPLGQYSILRSFASFAVKSVFHLCKSVAKISVNSRNSCKSIRVYRCLSMVYSYNLRIFPFKFGYCHPRFFWYSLYSLCPMGQGDKRFISHRVDAAGSAKRRDGEP